MTKCKIYDRIGVWVRVVLTRNRAILLSEEKPKKHLKQYYVPRNYSTVKKTDRNISSHVKREDIV